MKYQTCDGVEYHIRPIVPADAARERAFIAALSPQSRFQRFMHVIGEPTDGMIDELIHVDGHARMALVATVGKGAQERFIAVARYAADAGGQDCEFAIVVADDWQCRGIGSTLAPLLFEHAARQGFRSIYGHVLADNSRMIELARHLGLTVEAREKGETTVRASRTLNSRGDPRPASRGAPGNP
jgi:acetyltransferase